MSKIEKSLCGKVGEESSYNRWENFIRENYPVKSHFEIDDLLGSGLDGMKVIERKDKSGDIEGIVSYDICQDNRGIPYILGGVMLVRGESRGEGIMQELFSELKKIAEDNKCEYITAIADTEDGRNFLLKNGFNYETDEVNGREYLKLDL